MAFSQSGQDSNTLIKSQITGEKGELILVPGFALDEVQIKFCDMDPEMKDFAITCAKKALKKVQERKIKFSKGLAESIKKEFDAQYNSVWHVVVGSSFGFYVSYHTYSMVLFEIMAQNFLVYRFG